MIKPQAIAYFQDLSELLSRTQATDQTSARLSLDEGVSRAVQMLLDVGATARKMMLIGNGGSAAIASHIQNDLCKGVGLRALVFNEQPLLTAISNDIGYGCVFEHPIELWANKGDLLLAISSSGQSENILRGVKAALARGCQVITLSGFRPDNQLRQLGSLNFYLPSEVYGLVETAHLAVAHCIADNAMHLRRAAGDAQAEVSVHEEEYV